MSFADAVQFVLQAEGDETSDPRDRGGRTKYGISTRAHPEVDLDTLTLAQAIDLYRSDYWTPIRGDDLHPAVALVLFDWAVNSGVATAVENLQTLLGVSADGVFGPKTLAAVDAAPRADLIRKLLEQRAADRIYQGSTHDQRAFLRGWINRVIAVSVAAARQLQET